MKSILILLLFPITLLSQLQYPNSINYKDYVKAWSLLPDGLNQDNLAKQQYIFEQVCQSFPSYCNYLTENLIKQKKYNEALLPLKIYLSYTKDSAYIERFPVIYFIKDSLINAQVEISKIRANYFYHNQEAQSKILSIIKEDSNVRPNLCVKDSLLLLKLQKQNKIADSITLSKIQTFIKDYGWFGIRLINEQESQEINRYFSFKFNDEEYSRVYLQLILNAIKKGECSWSEAEVRIFFMTFRKISGYRILSFFKYDQEDIIDFSEDISQIQAQVLINYLNQKNAMKIELCSFENPNQSIMNKNMKNLRYLYDYIYNQITFKERLILNDNAQSPLFRNEKSGTPYKIGFRLLKN